MNHHDDEGSFDPNDHIEPEIMAARLLLAYAANNDYLDVCYAGLLDFFYSCNLCTEAVLDAVMRRYIALANAYHPLWQNEMMAWLAGRLDHQAQT